MQKHRAIIWLLIWVQFWGSRILRRIEIMVAVVFPYKPVYSRPQRMLVLCGVIAGNVFVVLLLIRCVQASLNS